MSTFNFFNDSNVHKFNNNNNNINLESDEILSCRTPSPISSDPSAVESFTNPLEEGTENNNNNENENAPGSFVVTSCNQFSSRSTTLNPAAKEFVLSSFANINADINNIPTNDNNNNNNNNNNMNVASFPFTSPTPMFANNYNSWPSSMGMYQSSYTAVNNNGGMDSVFFPQSSNVPLNNNPPIMVNNNSDIHNNNNSNNNNNTKANASNNPQKGEVHFLEEIIKRKYYNKCKKNNIHMIGVFNLEPRTTKEQLNDIFFAMGACDEELIDQSVIESTIQEEINNLGNADKRSYNQIANSSILQYYFNKNLNDINHLLRRGVGVVFFTSKDCAAVALSKFNGFVPNNQHQPIAVHYCGPDNLFTVKNSSNNNHNTTNNANNINMNNSMNANNQGKSKNVNKTTGSGHTNNNANLRPWMLQDKDDIARVHQEMYNFYHQLPPLKDGNEEENVTSKKLNNNISQTMMRNNQHLVCVHGLDPLSTKEIIQQNFTSKAGVVKYELWPLSQENPLQKVLVKSADNNINNMCKSACAVLAFQSERMARAMVADFNGKVPANQSQAVHLYYLNDHVTVSNRATGSNNNHRDNNNNNTSDIPFGLTAPTNEEGSRLFDKIDRYFVQRNQDEKLFLVGVHNLGVSTDKARLHNIFYPMGAIDSFLLEKNVIISDKPRKSGYSVFMDEGMAMEAAGKLNNFVPHGQTKPLFVRYLDKKLLLSPPSPINSTSTTTTTNSNNNNNNSNNTNKNNNNSISVANEDNCHFYSASSNSPTNSNNNMSNNLKLKLGNTEYLKDSVFANKGNSSTTNNNGMPSAATPRGDSPDNLLRKLKAELERGSFSQDKILSELIVNYIKHADTTKEDANKLSELISGVLISMQGHSNTLSSPLSTALTTIHKELRIKQRIYNANNNNNSNDNERLILDNSLKEEDEEKYVHFLKRIASGMMALLENSTAPEMARRVAAVLCAYIFQYSYTSGSPYGLAVSLLKRYAKEIQSAKLFIERAPNETTKPEEHKMHLPYTILIRCLEEMTSLWRQHNKSRAKKDENLKEFEQIVSEFRGSRPFGKNTNSSSNQRAACMSTPGGNSDQAIQKKNASITPSHRPTPRRVMEKHSPAIGSATDIHVNNQSLGLSANPSILTSVTKCATTLGSANPTRTFLTPGSDRTPGVSEDISMESMMNFTLNNNSNNIMTSSNITTPAFIRQTLQRTGRGVFNSDASETHTPSVSLDNHEQTVYITKLPASMRAAQIRRLLLHFGEFNKVRVCRDDKEGVMIPVLNATQLSGGRNNSNNLSPHASMRSAVCYGFVEFSDSWSAKAMVEYFRNASHMDSPFDFLKACPPEIKKEAYFTAQDVLLLSTARCSHAKHPIHDQHKLDAPCDTDSNNNNNNNARIARETGERGENKEQGCQFGIVMGAEPIVSYYETLKNYHHPYHNQPNLGSSAIQQPGIFPNTQHTPNALHHNHCDPNEDVDGHHEGFSGLDLGPLSTMAHDDYGLDSDFLLPSSDQLNACISGSGCNFLGDNPFYSSQKKTHTSSCLTETSDNANSIPTLFTANSIWTQQGPSKVSF